MNMLRQFFIIICISFAGELLKLFLPFPVPASIYGLLIMLLLLLTGVLKLGQVKHAAYFLIEIMPLMFLPPAIGLLDAWPTLQAVFIPIIVITLVSTIVVMGTSAKATDILIHIQEKRSKHERTD